jgi:hypothetical protein
MVWLALIFWLVLTIFLGMGVYALWARLIKPAYLAWVLLPGTVVSEMAYIFGSLITGGEVRSKLIPSGSGKEGAAGGGTQAKHSGKFLGPMVASLIAIAACGAAMLATHALLGKPVTGLVHQLDDRLPTSWQGFWEQGHSQLTAVQRMFESLADLRWSDWRVPLFVYLSICLGVQLVPSRRPVRPTLAAVVAIAAVIAIAGALSTRFDNLLAEVWPLVSYVWTMLLVLLTVTLLSHAVAALVRALSGKSQ